MTIMSGSRRLVSRTTPSTKLRPMVGPRARRDLHDAVPRRALRQLLQGHADAPHLEAARDVGQTPEADEPRHGADAHCDHPRQEEPPLGILRQHTEERRDPLPASPRTVSRNRYSAKPIQMYATHASGPLTARGSPRIARKATG